MNDPSPSHTSVDLSKPLPPGLAWQVDKLGDEFAKACRDGRNPRIEEFVPQLPEAARLHGLRELITEEVDYRREVGQRVSAEEYRSRFPEALQAVDAALAICDRSQDPTLDNAQPGEDSTASQPPVKADPPLPARVGGYLVRQQLGGGGFRVVYLGYDESLDREVVLKLPRMERFASPRQIEQFLQEARTAAKLEHPGIVRVHHVIREDRVCIVQEYVPGGDLGAQIQANAFLDAPDRIVDLLIQIAQALAYAHQHHVFHRDLKPENILLDADGRPRVADFGLALHESVQLSRRGERSGTSAYMSPEQVRGESHHVDERSDIWSLGVILYEAITGRRPFKGRTREELFEEIEQHDPRPPRAINPAVAPELQRICLKCLQRRMSDRYDTAMDLAADLGHWRESQATTDASVEPTHAAREQESPVAADSAEAPLRIIPKGLRSFDEEDANFFLGLLPGPRDRDGLPESIRFWKRRIEETDPDKTFAVGLIYGPSGCGKSSLVKAGLLPRLAAHVAAVYVEATPDDTEVRLLKALRKRFAEIPEDASLPEVLGALREGLWLPSDRKVTVILDQFEQWLHSWRREQTSQIVQALRQCDGGRVQCVVTVRDDFWMPVTRLFDEVEAHLIKGHNGAAIDRFDLRHAERVLQAFGRAYGALANDVGGLPPEQQQFLQRSVAALAETDRVACVRLALFADMAKSRPWTPATLESMSGLEGVGVAFLDETFSAETANPKHRLHQKAARAVLKVLLPESGTDIKARMRSYDDLLEVSGYGKRPKDFRDLVHILDQETRLITPTDPEGGADDGGDLVGEAEPSTKYYQLTHDYLAPSLREWLTRKQKNTRRGRAERRLAERAAVWNAKPENRHLPAWWETLNIHCFTAKKSWTEPQHRMMKRAARFHGVRWGIAIAIIVVASVALNRYIAVKRVVAAVDALQSSRGEMCQSCIQDLRELPRDLVVTELQTRYSSVKNSQGLPLAYGLAAFGDVDDKFLTENIQAAPASECANIAAALFPAHVRSRKTLARHIDTASNQQDWRLKARLAIVAMCLGELEPATDMLQVSNRPDPIQRTVFINEMASWHGDLRALAAADDHMSDPALRSGICLGIGSIPTQGLDEDARQAWVKVFSDWHRNQADRGTHSASGWALRTWRSPLPNIQPFLVERKGFEWEATHLGLTMLHIPAGAFIREDGQTVSVSAFLLSDREISVGLFQQFVDDEEYRKNRPDEVPKHWEGPGKARRAGGDPPVQNVSWYDAVMFCNWLSRKGGRDPCYERTDEKEKIFTEEHDAWQLIEGTDGFRLPTEAQWECACRAGTTTAFAFGDEESWLDAYGVYRASQDKISLAFGAEESWLGASGPYRASHSRMRGSKMCNGWGLFDMHGNVGEWCNDWYGEYAKEDLTDPQGLPRGSYRVLRGGGWDFSARRCRSAIRSWYRPSARFHILGFRVAQVPPGQPSRQPGGAESGSR